MKRKKKRRQRGLLRHAKIKGREHQGVVFDDFERFERECFPGKRESWLERFKPYLEKWRMK